MSLSTATTGSDWVGIALLMRLAGHALSCAGCLVWTSPLRCGVISAGVAWLGTTGAVVAGGFSTIAPYFARSAGAWVSRGKCRREGHTIVSRRHIRVRGVFPGW